MAAKTNAERQAEYRQRRREAELEAKSRPAVGTIAEEAAPLGVQPGVYVDACVLTLVDRRGTAWRYHLPPGEAAQLGVALLMAAQQEQPASVHGIRLPADVGLALAKEAGSA